MNPPSVIAPCFLSELAAEAERAPEGDFVEVGVYQGGSAAVLAEVARKRKARLWLFDTFAGIPFQKEGVDHHKPGDFCETSLELVKAAIPDAICVRGVFPETLTDDVGPIALAHIDCDQYQSVYDCCMQLEPRMVPGGVMWFDDPGCLQGASQAVLDAFPKERIQYSPLGKWKVYF